MTLLVLGMLLFACVHFIPSLAPGIKVSWTEKMGENGYKGVFSLLLLGSFALIIGGWRSTPPTLLYAPVAELKHLALGLLLIAFLLLAVSNRSSRLRLVFRHPQLSGVALWGLAHLLLNGDNRSVVLFGGMALWAVLEILAINRREGVWKKEEAPALGAELLTLLITAITVAVVIYIHPWLSGMPVF